MVNGMTSTRIFSEAELHELATPTLEKAKAAIDSGDTESAKQLLDDLNDGFTGLHDGYMIWISGLLSWIYRNAGGSDAVEAAEREAHTIESKLAKAFKPVDQSDSKAVVTNLLRGIKGHVHQPMTITEDDEKVIITVEPCGSGGRLLAMGGFEPGTGLVRIPDPHAITWQREDFPIYCVHCPIMGALGFERTGDFSFVKTFTETEKGSRCEYLLYKDKKDIPEEFYARIGKKRPVQD